MRYELYHQSPSEIKRIPEAWNPLPVPPLSRTEQYPVATPTRLTLPPVLGFPVPEIGTSGTQIATFSNSLDAKIGTTLNCEKLGRTRERGRLMKRITRDLMRAGTRALTFASVFFVSVVCGSASTTWNLVGVHFSDGATETGFFTIDSTFTSLTDWNIQVSGSSKGADFDYLPSDSNTFGVTSTKVVLGDFAVTGDFTELFFATPMTNAGGTINLTGSSLDCFNGPCGTLVSGQITAGSGSTTSVAASPEPGSFTVLSACCAFVLGLWLYRRRPVDWRRSAR